MTMPDYVRSAIEAAVAAERAWRESQRGDDHSTRHAAADEYAYRRRLMQTTMDRWVTEMAVTPIEQ